MLSIHGFGRLLQALQPRSWQISTSAVYRIAEAQRRRILERVEQRGEDVHGNKFAPYSTRGPTYIYPEGHKAGRGRKAAASRLAKKLGLGRSTVTRTGGIKFESYAAYKQALGRSAVDLTGAHRRMLGQLVVAKVTTDSAAIGIYGEAARRATGHQKGSPKSHLPRRHWLGFTAQESLAIREHVRRELAARRNSLGAGAT